MARPQTSFLGAVMRHLLTTILLSALLVASTACNEPVVFDPNQNNAPTPDPTPDMGPVMDPEPDPMDVGVMEPDPPPMDVGPGMEVIEPDLEFYAQVIRPMLIQGCGSPSCHGIGAFGRLFLTSVDDDPSEMQIGEDLANLQMFITYDNAEDSVALRKSIADPGCCEAHPLVYDAAGEDYQTILRWIADSVKIVGGPEGDAGTPDANVEDEPEDPTDQLPCDSFPDPNTLPGDYDYGVFQENINPLLIQRCARIGGCHSVPGNGGGLWIVREEDECSTTWNYLGVRWFINPSLGDVESSPLLSQPLGQQQPNELHGGSVVFQGRDDCGYVALKLWIEDAFVNLPLNCRE